MKRLFAIVSAAAAILSVCSSAHAQEKVHYRATTFVMIPPDKQAAALELIRTAGVKLAQENINAGREVSWSMLRTVYSGVGAPYNFIQVINYDGPPPADLSPEARDKMVRKATGMSFEDYQKKLLSTATSINSVLSRVEESVPASSPGVGGYVRVLRWKLTPGREADYTNYIKTQTSVVEEGVKQGVFQSWSAARTVFPVGDNVAYDATTSFIYKDVAQVLSPPPANPNQGAPASFAKVFPDKSYSAYVDEGRQLRHLVRQELWRVVASAGPAAR